MRDTVFADPRRLAEHIRAISPQLVVFDFGGTLLDFLPIHIAAFVSAMDCDIRHHADIAAIVADHIAEGADSYVMAQALIQYAPPGIEIADLVKRKREIVERLISLSVLDDSVVDLLLATIACSKVSLITRGYVRSMVAVTARSLPEVILDQIYFFGRDDMLSRVNKAELILNAKAACSFEGGECLYVGDANSDATIASQANASFCMARIFGG